MIKHRAKTNSYVDENGMRSGIPSGDGERTRKATIVDRTMTGGAILDGTKRDCNAFRGYGSSIMDNRDIHLLAR